MARDDTRPHAGGATAGLAQLGDLLGGESTASRRFLGGLIAGALVGAAVAGTSLLRARRPTAGPREPVAPAIPAAPAPVAGDDGDR